jgi:hypothetical protein
MVSKQGVYLEAVMRSIAEDTTLYSAGGITATLFNLTDGEIWINKSDGYIKTRLTNMYQTAIRIAKPRHTSQGVTGSYYNHIEESQLIIQIDVFSRNGEDYANDLLRILEQKFVACVEKKVNGTNVYLDVDSIQVQDAYEDPDVEAMHAVISLFGHYRGNVST